MENNLPHYDIVICTPGDILHAPYVESLTHTMHRLWSNNISHVWINDYSPYVAQSRDLIINGGWNGNNGYNLRFFSPSDPNANWNIFDGKFTYSQIVWIDNDISWDPDDFLKIISHKEPIVTGLYLTGNMTYLAVFLKDFNSQKPKPLHISDLHTLDKNRLHLVHTCGMGFMKVQYGVIEKMRHPIFNAINLLPSNIKNTVNSNPLDPLSLNTELLSIAEDTSFVMRANEARIPIYLDPSIKVEHYKKIPLAVP